MTKASLDGFERSEHVVNGVNTVVLSIGEGPDLVFLHGTGTFTGFDMARLWAEKRRVIIPFHPGFGQSDTDPGIDCVEDHVLHYMDLFDQLGLDRFELAGFSVGAWIAAEFAIRQPTRVERLVLVAPAGLVDEETPAPDIFTIPPQELPAYLAHDPAVPVSYFPAEPDPAFEAQLGREMQALGVLVAANPQGNPKLARWVHRLTMPTLLLWGANDRLRPTAQSETWMKLLPETARRELVSETGHLVFEETPAAGVVVLDFLTD
ncbi:alpha/beta fold hydrolase [Amorphus sp. 3PC139-8]|uniref:alpha/beta fold hydrolase n=1 Tax=Amorphus sp. 3PC139-8 TaxID=2735676 RepID=UPI00345CD21F